MAITEATNAALIGVESGAKDASERHRRFAEEFANMVRNRKELQQAYGTAIGAANNNPAILEQLRGQFMPAINEYDRMMNTDSQGRRYYRHSYNAPVTRSEANTAKERAAEFAYNNDPQTVAAIQKAYAADPTSSTTIATKLGDITINNADFMNSNKDIVQPRGSTSSFWNTNDQQAALIDDPTWKQQYIEANDFNAVHKNYSDRSVKAYGELQDALKAIEYARGQNVTAPNYQAVMQQLEDEARSKQNAYTTTKQQLDAIMQNKSDAVSGASQALYQR